MNYLTKWMRRLMILCVIVVSGTVKADTLETIKIGLMPATDSIPILWAIEKGYFEAEGLRVEVQPFTNGLNRITAMQTGNLDADIEGNPEFLALAQENPQFGKMVLTTPANFQILTSVPLDEVEGTIKVGSALNSIIHYLTTTYFDEANLPFEETFIMEIPVRLQMLTQKQLQAAILPEPMATAAELKGLTKTSLDLNQEPLNSVVFRQSYLDGHEEAVNAFVRAYQKAMDDLRDPQHGVEAKRLLIETFELPQELEERMSLPDFKVKDLPTEAYIKHIQSWLEDQYHQPYDLSYDSLIWKASN